MFLSVWLYCDGNLYVDVHPVRNNQGVVHKRNLVQAVISPIPDLRSGMDDTSAAGAFQGNSTTCCITSNGSVS